MIQWFVIVLSVLLPIIILPILLPTLILMAKRKRIIDAPNYRKTQQRPVSLMGGMLVVCVMVVSLSIASIYVPLNDLFPAMCMVVLLMTIGLIDDSIDLSFYVKFVIQVIVVLILCFAGPYRITSLWTVFGIETLPLGWACVLSVLAGVAIMNAINFLDGIDGLTAVYGMFVGVVMTVWGIHHHEFSHAILSLIIASSMFAFGIFNGFASRYKIYLGDSGSLVLGLYVYLSVCKILSHRIPQAHLSNGYEVAFVVSLLAVPLFDSMRVIVGRIVKGKSPFKGDRTHLHHVLVDLGYTHLTACLLIILINIFVFMCWGFLVEWKATHTMHLGVICLISAFSVFSPYYQLNYIKCRHPERYERYQLRVRRHRMKYAHRHQLVTRVIDNIPTIIR